MDGVVVVHGSALPEFLAVVPTGALELGRDLVPTAGSWQRDGDAARFAPRFGAAPGSVHVVVGRTDVRDAWSEVARVTVPGAHPAPSALVLSIDPGCDEVPANLLRFAVTFSQRMEEGSAAGRIRLQDASGADLAGTLLEMPPELWDADRRRLTVLLEPGRIKRGLQPNVQAGPPLREGMTVTLVVDPGIRDVDGAALVSGAERSYRVGAAVRTRVDPALWDVRWPRVVGDPLVVRFDRPLDRALVRRCLHVVDGRGHPVPGHGLLDGDASVWTFGPIAPGDGGDSADGARGGAAPAQWRLQVDTRLEDLAGNSVRRVFDRDIDDAADDGIEASLLVLWSDGRVEHSL
jgi:hypothetical protein